MSWSTTNRVSPAVRFEANTFRMNFNDKRRQQFLRERSYQAACKDLADVIELLESAPAGSGRNEGEGWLISYRMAVRHIFDKLTLRYTAGEAIDPLRQELDQVVAGYERATRQLPIRLRSECVPKFRCGIEAWRCSSMV